MGGGAERSPLHESPAAPLGPASSTARRAATGPGASMTREDIQRLRARLHDTTLQTLEFIASGGMLGADADLDELMRLAAREVTELRECLAGLFESEDLSLAERLARAVAHERCFAMHDVVLELGPTDGSIRGMAATELASAVREALTNARKHARASHVVVRCEEHAGTTTVVVEDDGVGGDLTAMHARLGIRVSIIGRMARLGGEAKLATRPGTGTRVTLLYGEATTGAA